MRNMIRIFSLLLVLLLFCSCGKKAPEAAPVTTAPQMDAVIVTVNGQEVLAADFEPYRQKYLTSLSAMGMDASDAESVAYVEDSALSACIQDLLLSQDIVAQGCYTFSAEEEDWMKEMGTAAYENALLDVQEYLRSTLGVAEDADMTKAALTYAENLGVSAENYINVYRDQYASSKYDAWLTRDMPVTDEDVQAAFDAAVEKDKAAFVGDIPAFEAAIASNEAVWYQPAGYRGILQILLPAVGETEAEKLASVQLIVDEIYARLGSGEPFEKLLAEFGRDANFQDEAFLSVGYSVHRQSVLWEDSFIAAAFGEDMEAPGSWSKTPLVSDAGVHILYYLRDVEHGAPELTDALRDALSLQIYQERVDKCLADRLEVLSAEAEVVFPA